MGGRVDFFLVFAEDDIVSLVVWVESLICVLSFWLIFAGGIGAASTLYVCTTSLLFVDLFLTFVF